MIECVQNVKIDSKIVSSYIDNIENNSLFKGAERYDVKGLRYYEVNKNITVLILETHVWISRSWSK